MMIIFLSIFVITLILVLSPFGFPYSGNQQSPTPQRFMIYHTRRIFHDENMTVIKQDSGYFILNLDRNTPRTVSNILNDTMPVYDDCDKFLFCGMPLSHPRMIGVMRESTWMPAQEPTLSISSTLHVTSKDVKTSTEIEYSFMVSGSDRLNVYISPKSGSKLLSTNLTNDAIPENQGYWNDRKVYFLYYTQGVEINPLYFSITLEVPKLADQNKKYLDIGMSSKYYNDDLDEHNQDFLRSFPEWADVALTTADYVTWIL